jgi:hypothetical protein
VFVGDAIGRVYTAVLKWSRRVRTANLPDEFRPLQAVFAKFTDEVLAEIEAYGPRARRDIETALAAVAANPSVPVQLDMTLTIRLSSALVEQFNRELVRAAATFNT